MHNSVTKSKRKSWDACPQYFIKMAPYYVQNGFFSLTTAAFPVLH